MLLLWEEKVLIREIWLNIYLTEMLNSNRKWIPWLWLHLLDYVLLILPFYLSNIFACNCSYEKNVIVRSNHEYDYFGNVLEYEYDYFPSYSSTNTQKVLVLEYEYKYTSTITPSLLCRVGWMTHWLLLDNQTTW